MAQSSEIKSYLYQSDGSRSLIALRNKLEDIRQKNGMDLLTLINSEGLVVFRTRLPFHSGDSLTNDPMISHVLLSKEGCKKDLILDERRLKLEGNELVERCVVNGGEPRGMFTGAAVPIIDNDRLLGVLQMGTLLNGDTEIVDRIREGIFENEFYNDKPIGTATIFMGDLRISTNVVGDDGRRAIGTRVSEEVREHVLENGLPWTGKAWVVNAWYLSRYDPIKDPGGNVIGMLYIGELEEKYLDMRANTVELVLGIIFSGMIVALIISFLIIRNILIPVKKLSKATQSISNRDLPSHIDVKTRDEVGNLANSFNQMADRLNRHEQKITQKQNELESINRELKTTNRNYMEMLGFVSHELKNPLASAVMSLYTVKDGYLGEITEAQEKGLASVAKSLDYFQDMIKNYLDLSRLEKGELKVDKKKILLKSEVIDPILAGLEREMSEKNIKVENHVFEDTELFADRDLLRIVYDNLLSNAIKYGREGGVIRLDGKEDKSWFTLSVFNEGQGIPKDKIGRLFKKFSRIDITDSPSKKGTGLGLYICKEIIENHGGEIWVESQVGSWAKFVFSLPKQK
ncbi:cache domain-containing protein [Acidobacteriota bacterium]